MTTHKTLRLKQDIDNEYQVRNEKEEMPVLKITWMHQFKDWKTT